MEFVALDDVDEGRPELNAPANKRMKDTGL